MVSAVALCQVLSDVKLQDNLLMGRAFSSHTCLQEVCYI